MINFGNMPQRTGNWAWLKPLINQKSLVPQYEEDAATYVVYGYDGLESLSCTIWKGTVPDGVIAGGYSQATNDSDKTDFETNFKSNCNRSIDDIPSRVFTAPLKNGGSANLAVDGSVTPVVFTLGAPANWDLQVNQLSFLFETTTAIGFGNKFMSTVAALTNGLLLECKAADLAFTWQVMKRTRDVVEISSIFDIITGTTNFFRANVLLPSSLRLYKPGTYGTDDYLRVTVRDNISALTFAEAYVQGVKL